MAVQARRVVPLWGERGLAAHVDGGFRRPFTTRVSCTRASALKSLMKLCVSFVCFSAPMFYITIKVLKSAWHKTARKSNGEVRL